MCELEFRRLHHQGDKTSNRSTLRGITILHSVLRANAVPSSPILVTLMMGAILSSKTSVFTRATQHHIPEDGILIVAAVKTSNLT
jgi:hypothetical protein